MNQKHEQIVTAITKSFLFGIFVFVVFIAAAPQAHAANYSYYRAITVSSATSVASGTNSNFPMLFSGTYSWLEASSSGGRIQNLVTAPNGGQEPADLIFTTSTPTASGSAWNCGTSLNFETESYTSTTGAINDWVNVPSLSAGSVIYACYSNSSVTADQSHPSSTWNANYAGVWHLPNGTTLSGNDSTANGNNSTVNGATATTGVVDGASAFNGSSNITTPYLQNAVTAYTMETWIKDSDTSNIQPIIQDRGSDGSGLSLSFFLVGNGACGGSCGGSTGDLMVGVDSNSIFIGVYGSTALTDGTWHHVVATWAASSGTTVVPSQFALYVDGQQVGVTADSLAGSPASPLTGKGGSVIGYHQAWSEYFTGSMDEVRISTVVRSPSWILTEYNNQKTPSTFYAVGSEQSPSVGPPDATSVSTTVGGNGGRSGDGITITGTNFGTVATSSAATCNGGTGTGCIKFIVGGTDTVASANITSWSNTSITFTISPTLASNGGAGALQVWAANASDTTPLAFYIYPNITAVTALGANAAREYNASDYDGLIMLSGDHFGTSGTSTILGYSATQYNSANGPCSVGGYTSTTACLEVPTGIANNVYSGTVVLNRSSDNLQATTSLSILPRITAINPSSTAAGTVMQIVGNHFCQTGTCPVSPNRASASNEVVLGGSGGGEYSYYRSITVGSNASGTQTNFPMLVSSTLSSWASVSHGGDIQNVVTAPNGGQEPADLVFATSSNCAGTPLNFETESYSSSTGAIADWINVPSLSAGSVIYACYGNPAVTIDQSHPLSVWNSSYDGVWHLNQGGLSTTTDSTVNNINGANASLSSATGKIGGASTFSNGASSVVALLGGPPANASATFSSWIYPTAYGDNGQGFDSIIGQNSYWTTYYGYGIELVGSDVAGIAGCNDNNWATNLISPVPLNQWSYVVFTMSGQGSGQTGILYVNGVAQANYTGNVCDYGSYPYEIGGYPAGGVSFTGTIDETRALNTALSPSWILTEYNNQNNPSTFYTMGSEQTSGAVVPDSNFVNETGGGGVCNGSGAAWSDGEMCATIPTSTALGVTQTTITSNGNISNAYSFTITAPAPGTPGTPTFSSVSTSTLTVSWTSGTNSTYYSLVRATSSGGTYAQITTTTSLLYNDSGLSPGTTYWYKVRGVNGTGNGSYSGSASTTTVSTTNSPPNAPSQDAPASGVQNVSVTPTFLMTATDPESNSLQYKVTIYSNSGCTTVVQTDDESASQTGWSGQNASSSKEYTSGTQGSFTVQSALSQATTYYWQASAKDPEGSNTWTNSAACNSFTTTSGLWTTDSGHWGIVSNQLVVTPGSGNYVQIHVTGQNITNDIVEFKTSSGNTNGDDGAIFRADASSNRYELGDADYADQLHRITKTVSNSFSTIGSSAVTLSQSTWYDIRGDAFGPSLDSWINGTHFLKTTDSALSGPGFVGIGSLGNNSYVFTDFAIYASTLITVSSLPAGGSWSVLDHSGAAVNCNTGSVWDASTYAGQIPVDYDNGGGKIAVWTNNSCSGASSALYPSSGLATDIYGGDTYLYNPGGSGSGSGAIVGASTTITISSVGLVSD
jgi:hypothetical protein